MRDNAIIIDDIIREEWDFFQDTQNEGGRAWCQDAPDTFYGMRKGQFDAWSQPALLSYLRDLKDYRLAMRNPIAEKYGHMEAFTAPEKYEQIKHMLLLPSDEAKALAGKIRDIMIADTAACREKYPLVAGAGRPLRSSEDTPYATSVETYLLGELYTYSEHTLELLYEHVRELADKGIKFSDLILENTMKHYGYKSLDEAEADLAAANANR